MGRDKINSVSISLSYLFTFKIEVKTVFNFKHSEKIYTVRLFNPSPRSYSFITFN